MQKVMFLHSALQVKEMHNSLDLLFLCDCNDIHALCIFMWQNNYLCMKIVDEEKASPNADLAKLQLENKEEY